MSNILDIPGSEGYAPRMYASHELSQAVRTRRTEIGLTQRELATLAGLSRSTIIEIEKGTIKDLSLSRTAKLLEVLGLGLHITPAHPRLESEAVSKRPLDSAARAASVSYSQALPPGILAEALRSGKVPADYAPHMGTLLEEAPLSMLAKAVEQVHAETSIPRHRMWANMRHIAIQLKVFREIWNT